MRGKSAVGFSLEEGFEPHDTHFRPNRRRSHSWQHILAFQEPKAQSGNH
jgi:hypothetical protein